jgi:hypothetical protein
LALVCLRARDEREKYNKNLTLELKKLRQEVKDICKHFDDAASALLKLSLKTRTYIHAQVCKRAAGPGLGLIQLLVFSDCGNSVRQKGWRCSKLLARRTRALQHQPFGA